MIRSHHARAAALCLAFSSLARGAAAQIMSAPAATPNASPGTALADWNVTYRLPAGWRVGQSLGRLQMLVSNTEAGVVFLAPGLYSTPQEAMADLSVFYQQMQTQGYPIEQPVMGTIWSVDVVQRPVDARDESVHWNIEQP